MGMSADPTSTIEFACRCGASIRARPHQAGRVGRCPTCGERVLAPLPVATILARLAPSAVLVDTVADIDARDELAWLDHMASVPRIGPDLDWSAMLERGPHPA